MSHLPAGIAAVSATSAAVGPVIIYADCLDKIQQGYARLMALSAMVRNHTTYAVILQEDLDEVIRLAA